MLEIITPASDPNLLTVEEARAIVGLASGDTSKDAQLERLVDRVSAEIHSACRIARGRGAPRTLRQETVQETKFYSGGRSLILARRHEITLTSFTIGGVSYDVTDFIVDGDAGKVSAVTGTEFTEWPRGLAVVVYEAGFDEVPPDLAGAAADLLRIFYSSESRDPLVKSVRVDVDGIDEVETQYWVGATSPSVTFGIPSDIAARLTPYRNATYA